MEFNEIIKIIGILVFSGVITFAATPFIRKLAEKTGAIDYPGERHKHKSPTPLLGGIAMYIGFLISSLIFCEKSPAFCAMLLGSLIIVTTGVIDDYVNLNPFIKFAAQFVAATAAIIGGTTIDFISIGSRYIQLGWLSIPITMLWIVLLTNSINLIDGLDGLSCGVSSICASSIMIVTIFASETQPAIFTAIIAGICFGFLPHNLRRRKIFMGDTGALFLGYVLSYVSVQGLFKTHAFLAFVVPVIIFGLPIFDTGFAFIRRIVHGKNPFIGDAGHLHHRLLAIGFSERKTVATLYLISGIFGIAAILLSGAGIIWTAGVAFVCSILIILVISFKSKKH